MSVYNCEQFSYESIQDLRTWVSYIYWHCCIMFYGLCLLLRCLTNRLLNLILLTLQLFTGIAFSIQRHNKCSVKILYFLIVYQADKLNYLDQLTIKNSYILMEHSIQPFSHQWLSSKSQTQRPYKALYYTHCSALVQGAHCNLNLSQ